MELWSVKVPDTSRDTGKYLLVKGVSSLTKTSFNHLSQYDIRLPFTTLTLRLSLDPHHTSTLHTYTRRAMARATPKTSRDIIFHKLPETHFHQLNAQQEKRVNEQSREKPKAPKCWQKAARSSHIDDHHPLLFLGFDAKELLERASSLEDHAKVPTWSTAHVMTAAN